MWRTRPVANEPKRSAAVVTEVIVEDDLAGLSREELAEEQRSFAERADRVRGRLTRNQAYLAPHPSPKRRRI
jgi:hypothetical protein